MASFPVDEFFVPELTTPATYTPSGGSAKQIDVLFDDQPAGRPIGAVEFTNGLPQVMVRSRDVPVPKAGDLLVLEPPLLDEESEAHLVDEDGHAILAEGLDTYYVQEVLRDPDGIHELSLSKDS